MAARPTWKGYLKISLVNIPIKVFPATDAGATLSFNQLHAECQTRIQQKRWCPHCEREVPNTDIVKGYEFEKGRYVVVDEEDIEKVRVDSTRVINLEKFTEDTAIDPIYLERPYYLAPDGPVASEAFAVIREGMEGKAGIGKVALYGREYLVKVQPRERGLIMYTLRHANEIRSMDAIDELGDVPVKVKPEEVKLARQVMGTFEGDVDFASYRDEYQDGLREIIDAKIEGREVVAPEVEAPPKVVNLMDALRKSLDSISASKKKPQRIEDRPEATGQKASSRLDGQTEPFLIAAAAGVRVSLHPGRGDAARRRPTKSRSTTAASPTKASSTSPGTTTSPRSARIRPHFPARSWPTSRSTACPSGRTASPLVRGRPLPAAVQPRQEPARADRWVQAARAVRRAARRRSPVLLRRELRVQHQCQALGRAPLHVGGPADRRLASEAVGHHRQSDSRHGLRRPEEPRLRARPRGWPTTSPSGGRWPPKNTRTTGRCTTSTPRASRDISSTPSSITRRSTWISKPEWAWA